MDTFTKSGCTIQKLQDSAGTSTGKSMREEVELLGRYLCCYRGREGGSVRWCHSLECTLVNSFFCAL